MFHALFSADRGASESTSPALEETVTLYTSIHEAARRRVRGVGVTAPDGEDLQVGARFVEASSRCHQPRAYDPEGSVADARRHAELARLLSDRQALEGRVLERERVLQQRLDALARLGA